MKILHLGFSDTNGGAAIAMMRLHRSLLKIGIDSNVLVNEKLSNSKNTFSSINNKFDKSISELKIRFSRQKKFFFTSGNNYSHSINFFSSNIIKKIDEINPDIINFHWINNEFFSIKQISKIKKPIIWTMLDMWPMCGGEHYTESQRYIEGYNKFNREKNESGFDLNKFIWKKKIKYYKDKIDVIICISDWQKKLAEKSVLFKNKKIVKVNLPLDIEKWRPLDKVESRKILNLKQKKKIFLFISTNGINDKRKGFVYIDKALTKLSKKNYDILLIIVGLKSKIEKKPYQIMFIDNIKHGKMSKLRMIYSSADLLLAPSILEAQGQVAVEGLSCGLPVVSFNNTGFSDIVTHKQNGYLSKYLNTKDFIQGIEWCLKKLSNRNIKMAKKLNNSVDKFSTNKISKKYKKIYEEIYFKKKLFT